ncbi:MAG TPA: helix-turn-helix transcriptional regulator [Armatimonadota bacterium]|nr:helix-turn-helix transcriptional regulator [Armatimonadota bacterium]
MTSEKVITEGSGNVFADLGYPDAEEHQAKARLVGQIADIVEERGLTHVQAAELFGIDPARVSGLLNGRFRGFSVFRLMRFIAALGRDVEIVTKKTARQSSSNEAGHISVR